MSDQNLLKYGEPLRYDPTFKGPLAKRSCTDIICLLIFIIFLCGWGFVAYFAYQHGDLNRLLVPSDSSGLRCGVDSEVLHKPYLLFFDLSKCADPKVPLTGCPTPQVCVEKCPSEKFEWRFDECNSGNFALHKSKLICDIKINMDDVRTCSDIEMLMSAQRCAKWYLNSQPFLKRCISDLLPTECPLIKSRKYKTSSFADIIRLPSFGSAVRFPDDDATAIARIASSEPKVRKKCDVNRALGKQIIVDKMHKTDTFIGRAFTNMFVWGNFSDSVQLGQMVVEDIIDTWPLVLGALVGSMIVCLIFIAIMRWLAAPVIWFSIFGVMALLGTGVYFSYLKYDYLKDNAPERAPPTTNISALLESYLLMKETWLYMLIALAVLLIVIVLAIIILRKRIVIAVALVKEGSKAVSSITSTVFFPIFPWLFQVAVIGFAVLCGLYLASIGTEVYKVSGMNTTKTCICTGKTYVDGEICNPIEFNQFCKNTAFSNNKARSDLCIDAACHFIQIQNPTIVNYFHGINIFGFFWTVFFISAFGEMVLAATFATWYWTFKKSEVPFFALTSGLSRTICYHLGTLAFGSFIIAVCRIIRVMLEWVHQKCKKYDNEVTRAILCIFRCLFWLLEKFLRFLNRNAYIMCAIHGKNFCASAGDAFNLLMRNCLRVVALDQVTSFLFFLSKLLISLGMGTLMYFYLSLEYSQLDLHYNLVPSIIVVIGTYLIACVFFSVYSMAVETLFLCFLEDSERNDGTPEKPYFMSKQLKKILGKHNKLNDSENQRF
ncbi:choline transporter-like 2 isoform X2 [Culicoides brevitarsis]|uniref:choline transporter-like 2 isoform X2 n=1 Tax=Culicoides brevitarsis TaxID=469753 RepID=UPI00307B35D5